MHRAFETYWAELPNKSWIGLYRASHTMWNSHKWLGCLLNLTHFPVRLTTGVPFYSVYKRLIKYVNKSSEQSIFISFAQQKEFANMRYSVTRRMFIIETYVREKAYNKLCSKFRGLFPIVSVTLKSVQH